MKHRSRLALAALAAGALGTAGIAFAHGGDREGGAMHGAESCPMRVAMQHGGQRMGDGAHGPMGQRGMAHGMRQGPAQSAPKEGEAHKH